MIVIPAVSATANNSGMPSLTAFFDASLPPTFAPTFTPTLAPTLAPTSSPTFTPTFAPTLAPTLTTLNPTRSSSNNNNSAIQLIPLVRPIRRDCSLLKVCGRCQGHCRYDSDCADGLICFDKKEFMVVGGGQDVSIPGCLGQDVSLSNNWCIVGIRNATQSIPLVRPFRKLCTGQDPCGRCQGHCRNNYGCKAGLICFQKENGILGIDSVPGCIGVDLSKTDWCTTPEAIRLWSP